MGARQWQIGSNSFDLSKRGMIMGILNVTPDSFSDGGEFFDRDKAVARACEMFEQGADIVDVGGESTRPGANPVDVTEELDRVIPVIEKLRAKSEGLISIDTTKAAVARAAMGAGANIINDVSGGRDDPLMFAVAAETKAALIIMHMQGTPRTMQTDPKYVDVIREVRDFFRQQYARAIDCAVDPMAIAFDPGIGFGKTLDHNLTLLANLEELRAHDQPVVIGVSRKSFISKLVDVAMPERLAPTIALTGLLRGRGADVFRVHDVRENVLALRMAEGVLEAAR